MMLAADDVRFLQQIAAAGRLAGAARMLGVTPPAITLGLQHVGKRPGVCAWSTAVRGICTPPMNASYCANPGAASSTC
jgi:hypothetical protein